MATNRKICVVGLGYVGLPLAVAFGKKEHVIGFDINEKKIEELKQNHDSMGEVDTEDLKQADIEYTANPEDLKKADFIIVAVPTPIDKDNKPDLTLIRKSSETVGKNLSKGTIVVYESTVYPGVTEEVCVPILEQNSNLKCGTDFKIGYSPERINPGDKEHTIDKIVKVVAGMDKETLDIVADVYSSIVTAGVHKAPNIKTAEGAKVIENIQRDLNIALMNELALIFQKIGISTFDVIDAAATKWNFHKYFPGLVGGHCLSKDQKVFVKKNNEFMTLRVEDLFNQYGGKLKSKTTKLEVLSFDVKKKLSRFEQITALSKRKYPNLIYFTTSTNQVIKVTDDHPMVIYEDNKFKVKHAKDVSLEDKFVVASMIPEFKINNKIDLINSLDKSMHSLVRVKPINKSFKIMKKILRDNFGKKSSNYVTNNYIPLKDYLLLEKKGIKSFRRDEIFLVTGRGPSYNQIKAILTLDADFARLIGYYLSEGCITKDKSLRTRWTFHSNEKDYIKDVCNCISKLGCKHSIYKSKVDKATHIKLSSNIFGNLLLNVLKCGKDSYDAKIPDGWLYAPKSIKQNILKGIIRGDGGVKLTQCENKEYIKRGKRYCHKNYSCEVTFFSISPLLFQQTVLLLHDFGVNMSFDNKRPLLYIHGHKNLIKMKELFLSDKKQKIERYFKKKIKYISSNKYELHKSFFVVGLKSISKEQTDYVFSLEVDKTKTLITDFGIVVHNCIGVDPYYLVYKAKELGYDSKIITAGRFINDNMHKNVAQMMTNGLKQAGKEINKSKILILGLTFKENINDPRNSRAKYLIEELKNKGANVIACDPWLENDLVEKEFKVKNMPLDNLGNNIDGTILVTPHKKFKELTLDKLKTIMNANPVLVDIKRFYNKEDANKLGITYFTY